MNLAPAAVNPALEELEVAAGDVVTATERGRAERDRTHGSLECPAVPGLAEVLAGLRHDDFDGHVRDSYSSAFTMNPASTSSVADVM